MYQDLDVYMWALVVSTNSQSKGETFVGLCGFSRITLKHIPYAFCMNVFPDMAILLPWDQHDQFSPQNFLYALLCFLHYLYWLLNFIPLTASWESHTHLQSLATDLLLLNLHSAKFPTDLPHIKVTYDYG